MRLERLARRQRRVRRRGRGRRVLLLVLRRTRERRPPPASGTGSALVRIGVRFITTSLQRRAVGDLRQRGAAGLQEQRAEVAVGVLDREQRAGVVVEPGQPPQVAVLGVARVVAEHVHEVVEHRERVAQVRAWPPVTGRRSARPSPRPGSRRRPGCGPPGAPRPRTGGSGSARSACPGTASAVSAWLAAGIALAAGSRLLGRRPEHARERLHLGQRRRGLLAASRAGRPTARLTLASSEAKAREHLLARVDQLDDLRLLGRQRVVQPAQRVHEALEVASPHRHGAVDARQVAVGRLEALHDLRQLVAAVVLQALAGAVDQQVEVLAAVGVERGEDLVQVDHRHGVRDRDRVAGRRHRRARRPRRELDEHVVQARSAGGSARSSSCGSGACTSGRGLICTTPSPFLSVTFADRARPGPRRSARSGPGPG